MLDKRMKQTSLLARQREVSKDLTAAMKRIHLLERELDAAQKIKTISSFSITPQFRGHGKSEAVAIAIASDWHVGEVVNAKSVNGLNKYNPDIAKERAITFFHRVVRLIEKERQDVHIDTLVLAILGDQITGRIHEENLETCVLRPIEETLFAQELLVSGIEFLLAHTDVRIIIPCHAGNHSRITTQVHAATEMGNSLESFMYHSMAQHFASEKRITFLIGDSYHGYLDIYGKTMRFHHGHAIRYGGGVGGLHIPMMKAIYSWNVTKPAHQDFCGHFHQYTPHKRFMVNGSLIGYNAYALRMKCEYEPPQQIFCLWDKVRGKTVTIPILF